MRTRSRRCIWNLQWDLNAGEIHLSADRGDDRDRYFDGYSSGGRAGAEHERTGKTVCDQSGNRDKRCEHIGRWRNLI